MSRRSDDRPLLEPFASLISEVPGTTRTFPIGPLVIGLDDDLRLAEPLHGRGRVTRTNRGLIVDLNATAALAESCSRCLDAVVTPIEVDVTEEVLPSLDLVTGARLDPNVEPEVLRLDDHHRLDLEPLLREAVSLVEPIAPLCRPDCPGLCETCGVRLADDPDHHHDDDLIDPRLAVLRRFSVDAGDENR